MFGAEDPQKHGERQRSPQESVFMPRPGVAVMPHSCLVGPVPRASNRPAAMAECDTCGSKMSDKEHPFAAWRAASVVLRHT